MTSSARPPPTDPHQAALAQYRRRASVYDIELTLFEPVRRQAITRLGLRPGDTVIDAGCGTGLSLPLLRAAVGATGRVVGIEQSPEMLAQARACVRRHGWQNVALIEASVEDARLASGTAEAHAADAALFHFTHDILCAPTAVANVMQALRPGASVVACGLKWTALWAWPVNLFVLGAALHSVTSLDGLATPWRVLAESLDELMVESAMAGAVFIAHGSRH
jgi:ubiquinone/menaquinone biosynthesis C-methylase UbiE